MRAPSTPIPAAPRTSTVPMGPYDRRAPEVSGGAAGVRPSGSTFVLAVLVLLAFVVVGAAVLGAVRDGVGGAVRASQVGAGPVAGAVPGPVADGGRRPARGLDPGLVAAYGRARRAAADAGHDLILNSGFRTPARQQELLDEEVAKRGSYEAAVRWVFPPDRSMHVQGLAIDVGDRDAAGWLREHGARFGLCHTLSWEWWHFEWRARWQAARACPREAADPSEAPPR